VFASWVVKCDLCIAFIGRGYLLGGFWLLMQTWAVGRVDSCCGGPAREIAIYFGGWVARVLCWVSFVVGCIGIKRPWWA